MPMFSGKGGSQKHFANPAAGRSFEKSAGADPEGQAMGGGAEHAPAGSHNHPPALTVSIHKAGDAHHTVGHHEGGVHQMQHGSKEEAMNQAGQCMEGSGGGGGMGAGGGKDDSWMGGGPSL